jgi:hypothetical protein
LAASGFSNELREAPLKSRGPEATLSGVSLENAGAVTGKTVFGLGNAPLDLQSFFDGLTVPTSSNLELSARIRARACAAPDEWHAYP